MAASISGCFGQERPDARNTVALRLLQLSRSLRQSVVCGTKLRSVSGSLETKRGFLAYRRLGSRDAHICRDLLVQQLRDLGVAKQPQSSG